MRKSKTALPTSLVAPFRGIPIEIVVSSGLEDYMGYLERVAARSELLGVRFRRRGDDMYLFELRQHEPGRSYAATTVKGYLKRVDHWSTLVSGKSSQCIECIGTLALLGSIIALGLLVWLLTGAQGAMPICAGIGGVGLVVLWVLNVAVYQERVRHVFDILDIK